MLPNPTAAMLQALLKNVESPSARTISMVQRILDRVLILDARTKEVSPDMVAFFWCKCASQDQAYLLQQQCDEQANKLGLVVIQKLNKVKKTKPNIPEDMGCYYTQMVIGFDGLLERARHEADFFQQYTTVVKDFQKRQAEWKIHLQTNVVEKLQSIRDSQYLLRDACSRLIKKLAELGYERHGFEMDRDDIAQLSNEYDLVLRRLTPSALNLQVETLTKYVSGVKSRLDVAKERRTLTADRISQLRAEVNKHQETINQRFGGNLREDHCP